MGYLEGHSRSLLAFLHKYRMNIEKRVLGIFNSQ